MLHKFLFLLAFLSCTTAVFYNLELTHAYHNSDGKYKTGYLVNGMSPGPCLFGEEGEWMEVNVTNHLPVSVTIHFHGILQKGTPWSDGVAGITQRPIFSGESFLYKFQLVNQSGASWYHAHYRGYLTDGVYGSMYIRPRKDRERPYELITQDPEFLDTMYQLERNPTNIIADDSFKWSMDDIMARMFHYGVDPVCIQSILINGKGRIYCHNYQELAQLATKFITLGHSPLPTIDTMGCMREEWLRNFTNDDFALESPGFSKQCEPTFTDNFIFHTRGVQWHYLNILNAGGQHTKAFSIDDHQIIVIAIDGVFVRPRRVHQLKIPVGSRFTILLETVATDHKNVNLPFSIRFSSILTPQFIQGIGYLVYDGSIQVQSFSGIDNGVVYQNLDGSLKSPHYTSLWPHQTIPYGNEGVEVPRGNADVTMNFYLNKTGYTDFSMFEDQTQLCSSFELFTPMLQSGYKNGFKNVPTFSGVLQQEIKYGQTVDFVLNNYKRYNHPVHLHGHLFHVISYSETENFPYRSIEEAQEDSYLFLNLKNPPYFDIILVPAGGHVVIRIVANNPGIWLMHCHNLGHLIGGMGAVLLEALDDMPPIPEYYAHT